MLSLFTPATGYPDLEAKIAYGLARVAIEAFGEESVCLKNNGNFYTVKVDADNGGLCKLDLTFNFLARRLLSSMYIPFKTPGIPGRSASSIIMKENDDITLRNHMSVIFYHDNKKTDNCCRHQAVSVGNIIGLTASTSFYNKRDGLDIQLQHKDPKDNASPKLPRRPTNPNNICKACAMLSLLGVWYASFIFSIKGREITVLPIPKKEISGVDLQAVFASQHQLRNSFFNQEIPQILIPLVFLSRIPSSAELLEDFDLFIAILTRQQGYHVDGILLAPSKSYLAFIKESPFNTATIDLIIRAQAFDSFLMLNKAIYYKDVNSSGTFAREYSKETSNNNFTNLLFPDTAKYLLKEIAMIDQKIIENPAISSLAKTLRYFIREKKYGYADDIRNARLNTRDFEETIAKMLREGELRRLNQEQDKKAGRKVENWIHLPKESEIKEIFRLANEDFEATKLALVILAFSFPQKADEQEKD